MTLDPIVAEVTVPVTTTEAFVGFTAQMGEWWDPMLTPDPAGYTGIAIDPDGPVASVHGDEQYVWGRVVGWDPIGHYTQEFWLGHAEEEPTTLDVTFTEAPEGTLVHLEHRGWTEGSEDVRARYTHWDDLLRRYAAHVS
ncbi:SRPBCC domain-containing protein [Nocardioides renjunii]|uniref:SRPBCC domain-containing protein n=1 Tax=Nocardioides renjunii TaxID=3095075 RepID=UPI002B003E3B|nr:SRPBCC domain-containing protein [Nocardioides sp. S-34]WQQ20924.1 SRPBCC domain-containing protein [Nocardioides sp. S-34]